MLWPGLRMLWPGLQTRPPKLPHSLQTEQGPPRSCDHARNPLSCRQHTPELRSSQSNLGCWVESEEWRVTTATWPTGRNARRATARRRAGHDGISVFHPLPTIHHPPPTCLHQPKTIFALIRSKSTVNIADSGISPVFGRPPRFFMHQGNCTTRNFPSWATAKLPSHAIACASTLTTNCVT
jgi:hypothetical protein